MVNVLPARPATRQRLAIGSLLVVLVSLFQLIGLEIPVIGSPWPIALLWAACGWAGLGVSIAPSILLMLLGLWVDVVTGATPGTWATIGLATYGLTLLGARFLGTDSAGPLMNCALSGLFMICVMVVFSLWQNKGIDLIGTIIPVFSAVLLYVLVRKWFELSEDES